MQAFTAGQSVRIGGRRFRQRRVAVSATTSIPSKFSTVSPVGKRVMVQRTVNPQNEQTGKGIFIVADSKKTSKTEGQVTDAAASKHVKNGDTVIFGEYAGTDITMENKEYVVLKEVDIIAVKASEKVAEIKPLGDRVLVEVEDAEEVSPSGILLAADSQEQPTVGTVIAVGPGMENDKGELQEVTSSAGSSVLYSKYAGTELTEEETNKQYIIIKESDILATLS